MKHKLIKVDDYYIVVSDEDKPSDTDWYYDTKQEKIRFGTNNTVPGGYKKKMIASQNPEHNLPSIAFSDEVAKELGIVDILKLAEESWKKQENTGSTQFAQVVDYIVGYQDGYIQALSDNKEKKYTEEDLKKALVMKNMGYGTQHIIQSLTPTPWNVELLMEETEVGHVDDYSKPHSFVNQPKITNNSVTILKIIK